MKYSRCCDLLLCQPGEEVQVGKDIAGIIYSYYFKIYDLIVTFKKIYFPTPPKITQNGG